MSESQQDVPQTLSVAPAETGGTTLGQVKAAASKFAGEGLPQTFDEAVKRAKERRQSEIAAKSTTADMLSDYHGSHLVAMRPDVHPIPNKVMTNKRLSTEGASPAHGSTTPTLSFLERTKTSDVTKSDSVGNEQMGLTTEGTATRLPEATAPRRATQVDSLPVEKGTDLSSPSTEGPLPVPPVANPGKATPPPPPTSSTQKVPGSPGRTESRRKSSASAAAGKPSQPGHRKSRSSSLYKAVPSSISLNCPENMTYSQRVFALICQLDTSLQVGGTGVLSADIRSELQDFAGKLQRKQKESPVTSPVH